MIWGDNKEEINRRRINDLVPQVEALQKETAAEREARARDSADVWKAIGDWTNSIKDLKTLQSPSLEFERRLSTVETHLGELRKLLLDETPRGRPKLSRVGRMIGQSVRNK